jgi:L-arabinose isomerase
MESDRTRFDASQVSEDLHRLSVQSGLAVRKWIERESLSGFSVNFQEITRKNKIPAMPFLEISKLLSRGIGFGGEGDVLTASLVGALAQVYGNVSFTEMFCPDWKNNTIFLSHMGEINLDLAAQKPVLIEKPWPFTDTEKPVIAAAAFKGGQAAIVDLAPGPSDTFTLIIAPGEMVSEGSRSNFSHLIRGWFRPDLPIHQFLKEYSLCGGTHHKALVYGNRKAELETFGKIMGWKTVVIE